MGGFKSVSHSIIPEAVFARELVATNKYSFIRANDTLDIQTRKSYVEQRLTAIRTRYPQLRKRPENVLLLVIAELSLLLGPFVGIIYGLVESSSTLTIVSAVAAVLLVFNHLCIIQNTSPANATVALINLPVENYYNFSDKHSVHVSIRVRYGAMEGSERLHSSHARYSAPTENRLNAFGRESSDCGQQDRA